MSLAAWKRCAHHFRSAHHTAMWVCQEVEPVGSCTHILQAAVLSKVVEIRAAARNGRAWEDCAIAVAGSVAYTAGAKVRLSGEWIRRNEVSSSGPECRLHGSLFCRDASSGDFVIVQADFAVRCSCTLQSCRDRTRAQRGLEQYSSGGVRCGERIPSTRSCWQRARSSVMLGGVHS